MNDKEDPHVRLFDELLIGMRRVRDHGAGVIESAENREATRVMDTWVRGMELLRARYLQLLADTTDHDLKVRGGKHMCSVIDRREQR